MKSFKDLSKLTSVIRENFDNLAESILTNTHSKFVVKEIQGGRNKDKIHYQISLALPGYSKEAVSITAENSVLTVTALNSFGDPEVTEYFKFDSTFDVSLASARMNNGLLVIVIPKDPSGPRDIKIQ